MVFSPTYTASKHGVLGLTKAWAVGTNTYLNFCQKKKRSIHFKVKWAEIGTLSHSMIYVYPVVIT